MLEVYDLERNTYFLGGVGDWLLLCAVYVSKSPCQGSHWTSAALCPVNYAVPLPKIHHLPRAQPSIAGKDRELGCVSVCTWAGQEESLLV